MGGVDEVVREWLCHVLIHCLMLGINDWIVFASKKAGRQKFTINLVPLLTDWVTKTGLKFNIYTLKLDVFVRIKHKQA